jgi:hypothetical protein
VEEFRYDTYCGLYCGACEVMKACQKGLATGIPARWEDLPERFRDNIGKSELSCRGCKTGTVFEGCRGCSIRACARGKKVESCILCRDYPCPTVLQKNGYLDRIGGFLPHTRVMFKNLGVIKEKGTDGWLRERERDWRCPQCGTCFSWYQDRCQECGKDLEPLKEHNKY